MNKSLLVIVLVCLGLILQCEVLAAKKKKTKFPTKKPTSSKPTLSPTTSRPSIAPTRPPTTGKPSTSPVENPIGIGEDGDPTKVPSVSSGDTGSGNNLKPVTLCAHDQDCPGRLICFSANSTSWMTVSGPGNGYCDCPRSLGRPDADCLVSDGSLEFTIAILGAFLLLAVILILFHVRVLSLIGHTLALSSALAHYFGFTLVSLVCGSIQTLLYFGCLFETDSFIYWEGHKTCTMSRISLAFGMLFYFAALVAVFNLLKIWLGASYANVAPHPIETFKHGSTWLIVPGLVLALFAVLWTPLTFWFTLPILVGELFTGILVRYLVGNTTKHFAPKRPPQSLGLVNPETERYKQTERDFLNSEARVFELRLISRSSLELTIALALVTGCGIGSFAILTGMYSWDYERSTWTRPSYWLFLAAQFALLGCFAVIVRHLRRRAIDIKERDTRSLMILGHVLQQ